MVSVQPQPWPEPAPEIAAAIRAMYSGKREVPLPMGVRDQLGELFADAEFAAGFGQRGRPGWSPGRLVLVTVLQQTENLTDRQAAEEVWANLGKYVLGLELADPGFDHTVLSEFRSWAVAHGLEEKGLGPAAGRTGTDSTHVITAVPQRRRARTEDPRGL